MRHDFSPGRLIAGLVLMLTAVVYFGDAGGAWETPWFVVVPLVGGGLIVAGVVGAVTGAVRARRRRSA
ncbi:hypothetical protein [Streptomyces sp. NPDC052225]|uniref:hypothetical protein n=1 Tax=Streptomyces sp. NPDC052225 TaxID=3154949 RepID=UPI00343DAAFF